MAVLLKNNAVSRLAASLTTGATSLSVTAGDGAKFPTPTGGDWFPLTLIKPDGTLEIVSCTSRSGDVLTIVRAQEGTAALAFNSGDRAELRVTAGALAEFGQINKGNFWSKTQTLTLGAVSNGQVQLTNGTADTPEISWVNPSWVANMDLVNDHFRIFASTGGVLSYPLDIDLTNKSATFYGNNLWHAGNFNPASYLPVGGKAADANLLDGIDSTGFIKKGTGNSGAGGTYMGATPPNIDSIFPGSSDSPALTISNDGNTFASAVIQFYRTGGGYAAYFGLDVDNKWKVGGRSMGAVSYELWTDQNGAAKAVAAQTSAGVGSNGSYGFFANVSGSTLGAGALIGGANLRYGAGGYAGGTAPLGTWRCMGEVPNGQATLFLRVS